MQRIAFHLMLSSCVCVRVRVHVRVRARVRGRVCAALVDARKTGFEIETSVFLNCAE